VTVDLEWSSKSTQVDCMPQLIIELHESEAESGGRQRELCQIWQHLPNNIEIWHPSPPHLFLCLAPRLCLPVDVHPPGSIAVSAPVPSAIVGLYAAVHSGAPTSPSSVPAATRSCPRRSCAPLRVRHARTTCHLCELQPALLISCAVCCPCHSSPQRCASVLRTSVHTSFVMVCTCPLRVPALCVIHPSESLLL
jgi:hypothetical protein